MCIVFLKSETHGLILSLKTFRGKILFVSELLPCKRPIFGTLGQLLKSLLIMKQSLLAQLTFSLNELYKCFFKLSVAAKLCKIKAFMKFKYILIEMNGRNLELFSQTPTSPSAQPFLSMEAIFQLTHLTYQNVSLTHGEFQMIHGEFLGFTVCRYTPLTIFSYSFLTQDHVLD